LPSGSHRRARLGLEVIDTPRRDPKSVLAWLVERIRDGYELGKIILFGPLARGATHEGSDIDLIVVKDTDASYGERVRELLPRLRG
jgi:predicted nucleotidyltransferase